MRRAHIVATMAAAAAAVLLTACGDPNDFPAAATSTPGCTTFCGDASSLLSTPVAVPTTDPALVAWRYSVHDRVAALMKDLNAVTGCGGSAGDDRADCHTKIATLMSDARAMRDAMDPHTVPPDAVTDAGKISDALDVLLQGCAHDDAAIASNQQFVLLPGDTTSKGIQQLVADDDALRTD